MRNLSDLLVRLVPGIPDEVPVAPELPQVAKGTDPELNRLNNQVVAMLQAGSTEKLEEVLIERATTLVEKTRENPAVLVAHALSGDVRNLIPSELQKFVEEKKKVTGRYKRFFVEDFFGTATDYKPIEFIIGKDLDDTYDLYFENKRPQILERGELASLNGFALDNLFVASESVDVPQVLGVYTDQIGQVRSSQAITGTRKALMLLFNFQDDASEPISAVDLAVDVLPKVTDFYKKESGGQLNLEFTTAGWFTIPTSKFRKLPDGSTDPGSCSGNAVSNWTELALEEYRNWSDVDDSQFKHVLIMFPKHPHCDFHANGDFLGGLSWYNGLPIFGIHNSPYETKELLMSFFVHELGHNFGADHAQAVECPNGFFGGDSYINHQCKEVSLTSEVTGGQRNTNNDGPSAMSYLHWYTDVVNAVDADKFGWIDSTKKGVLDVGVNKNFLSGGQVILTLDRHPGTDETNRVKIPLYKDNNKEHYYLEYSSTRVLSDDTHQYSESSNSGVGLLYYATNVINATRNLIKLDAFTEEIDESGPYLSFRLLAPDKTFSLKDGEYFYDKDTGVIVRQLNRYKHDGSTISSPEGSYTPPATDQVTICVQRVPGKQTAASGGFATNIIMADAGSTLAMKLDNTTPSSMVYDLGCRRIEYKIPEKIPVYVDPDALSRAIAIDERLKNDAKRSSKFPNYTATTTTTHKDIGTLSNEVWRKTLPCHDAFSGCHEEYYTPPEDGDIVLGQNRFVRVTFSDHDNPEYKDEHGSGGNLFCDYVPNNPVKSGWQDFTKIGCFTGVHSYYKNNEYNYDGNTATATKISISRNFDWETFYYWDYMKFDPNIRDMFWPNVTLEEVRMLEGGKSYFAPL